MTRRSTRFASIAGALLALPAAALALTARAAAPDADIESLRARATALAAESVVGQFVDEEKVALFAETAIISADDSRAMARAKYAGLAACGVKSWQAGEPAVERELLESVIAGRLVRADAMGYRGALAERVFGTSDADSDAFSALEDASLDIYLACEGEVDQQFARSLAAAQERTRERLRSAPVAKTP